MLKGIPISPGISDFIFTNLTSAAASLKTREKICILMFDEISLQPGIYLNAHINDFEGFEDYGDRRSTDIANYAQVYMLKGIASDWKQPISFTFFKGPTKVADLVRILKKNIQKCLECGFQVVATVSDQGSNNQAAVNFLMKNSVKDYDYECMKYYYINYKKIVHLYDTPHLLKGIRNNLLKYDLVWNKDGVQHTARWSDIEKAYQIDRGCGELRAMPKLTDHHIHRSKIRKMKVSSASQILSHTVASTINLSALTGNVFNILSN